MPKLLQIASSLSEIVDLQACSHAQITLSGKGGNITVLKVVEIAQSKNPNFNTQQKPFAKTAKAERSYQC